MAVLTTQELDEVWRDYMSFLSGLGSEMGAVTKQEVRTAVVDLDIWINDNQATINNALPLPFRAEATQSQKSLLFEFIGRKRYQTGA